MRFLVTGANGFVGSALCDELAAKAFTIGRSRATQGMEISSMPVAS
ncbi:NAD-dependent epimerase/dehydratase family protein [Pseudomonas sp. MDMC_285]|nr:NAD-dependent epimerase/dehydratase family protein [Pseudomonas sp. MDMC_285]